MRDNLTEIVMVLDKSGSMASLTDETIASFNNFIKEQKKVPGEVRLTVFLFDTTWTRLVDGKNLADVKDDLLDRGNYAANGFTALYDAMRSAIDTVGKRLADTPESERPGKVLFVTITDGQENSSRKYNKAAIADRVKVQTDVYRWTFLYLGCDMAQMAEGESIGTQARNMLQYSHDSGGVLCAFDATSRYAKDLRTKGHTNSLADYQS